MRVELQAAGVAPAWRDHSVTETLLADAGLRQRMRQADWLKVKQHIAFRRQRQCFHSFISLLPRHEQSTRRRNVQVLNS